MQLEAERELQDIERCLNDFGYTLGMLRRGSSAFIEPRAMELFGSFPLELDNMATVARTFAAKCAGLRRRMLKSAEWNRAYKEAYGVDHPEYVEERNG